MYMILIYRSINITYVQLVEGKPVSRYPWLTPQFYTDFLLNLI